VANKKAFAVRGMSNVLDAKEHAEESRFIRQMEAKQQSEVRAKLEAILALEDHHEEKKELVGLLGKRQNI
jgi:hypothetical protein